MNTKKGGSTAVIVTADKRKRMLASGGSTWKKFWRAAFTNEKFFNFNGFLANLGKNRVGTLNGNPEFTPVIN